MIEITAPPLPVKAEPKPVRERRTKEERTQRRMERTAEKLHMARRRDDRNNARAAAEAAKALTEEALQIRMRDHVMVAGDLFEERKLRAGRGVLMMRRVLAEIDGIVFYSLGGDKNFHCKRETFFRQTCRCLKHGDIDSAPFALYDQEENQ